MQELWDDERPDLRYKDFSRGTYRDSPPQRKARNLEQLDILVKFGENLTFEQMVEALERGRYFVEFGKGDEDWTKAKEELIETVNTEYPGALLDDYPFRLLRTNIANKTIPKKVKEKYVKCFILAESAAGRELYAETRELVPKEKDKLPF
jgi:hypothetical protein